MSSAKQILQCLIRLLKFPNTIDDWSNLLLIIKLEHSFKLSPRAIHDALEGNIPLQAQQVRVGPVASFVLLTGKVADARDQTTEAYALKRLA